MKRIFSEDGSPASIRQSASPRRVVVVGLSMIDSPAIDLGRVAQELQLKRKQVESVVALLDADNTVPFITRYRKEETGNLDEEQIRAIQRKVSQLRQLAERRQTILRTIESQGQLTEELKAQVLSATSSKRLEDLYLPYKPRKQTLATIARGKGLGPLADAIWSRDPAAVNLDDLLPGLLDPDKELKTAEEAIEGLRHILAERIADDADVREAARRIVWNGRIVSSRAAPEETDKPSEALAETGRGSPLAEFRNYFDYGEPVRQIPPHRILAINRGERTGVLKIRLEIDREALTNAVIAQLVLEEHPHRDLMQASALDAIERLLLRSLEREVRSELADVAEDHAVSVFARNLRNLLLQPPVTGRRVLAIDPGYRTGCKFAVLDEIGNLLEHGVVYPFVNRKKKKKRKAAAPRATAARDASPVADASGGAADANSVSEGEGVATAIQVEPPAAPPSAETPTPNDGDDGEPPILRADAVFRATGPDDGDESSIEDDEGESIEPGEPSEPSEPVALNPAMAGIVIPTPEGVATQVEPAKPARERPTPPAQMTKRDRAKAALAEVCNRRQVTTIVIGNGAGCRETEDLVSEVIRESVPDARYTIVNEAGASVYSASAVGREEFPEFDATLRGTISIGRRLLDPLSEFVKIEPQNIGVGLYQHDINPRLLRETLAEVVESCVNFVGVDLNTASAPLLQYVSGMNQLRARNVVEYRKQHGPFRDRAQLEQVPGVGPAVMTQSAGFLKVVGGDQPFDSTWIHPESYPLAARVLELLGYEADVLNNRMEMEHLRGKIAELDPEEIAHRLDAGPPTVFDILANLARPGRDPREDIPPPIFRDGVLKLEDLTMGMQLRGTVLNVVDFGVFVDVGLKDSGLIHISQLANRFIRSPHELLAVGDIITAWVLGIDKERRRVSLTMIEPGTARPPSPRGRRGPRRRDEGAPVTEGGGDQAAHAPGPGDGESRRRRPPRRPPVQRPLQQQPAAAPAQTGGEASPAAQQERPPVRRGGQGQGPGLGQRRPGGAGPRGPGGHGGPGRGAAPSRSKKPDRFSVTSGGARGVPQNPPDAGSEKGKDVLGSFAELKALFDANRKPDDKKPPKKN